MKITIAVGADVALSFDSPEEALLHLVGLTALTPSSSHDDRLQVLADRFTVLTNARRYWRRALAHYRTAEAVYADPIGATVKGGYAAFQTPEIARITLEKLEELICGIRAEMEACLGDGPEVIPV